MYSHSVDSLKHIVLCIPPPVSHPQAAGWTNNIPSSVKGLPGSCVVIPCSYDFPNPGKTLTQFTGIWKDHARRPIFHSVQSKIMQQYRNRTELLGDLSLKNCSLKIDPLQQSDQGPFSFRIEIANYDKFSYGREVSITMIGEYDFHESSFTLNARIIWKVILSAVFLLLYLWIADKCVHSNKKFLISLFCSTHTLEYVEYVLLQVPRSMITFAFRVWPSRNCLSTRSTITKASKDSRCPLEGFQ